MKSPHLVFEWPARHRIHLLLPAMVLAAALAHTAVFFLFAARQPSARQDGPNPAKVYFMGPRTAAATQLAPLLNLMDPALQAPGRGLPDPAPVEAIYTPQYLKSAVEFAPPPPAIPAAMGSREFYGPVEIPRKPLAAEAGSRDPVPTRLRASPTIAQRLPADFSGGEFSSRSNDIPMPAVFLIGISPDGRLQHVVTDQSSGDRELDGAAIRVLRAMSFAPAGSTQTDWGFVEFRWGTDLKSPPAP